MTNSVVYSAMITNAATMTTTTTMTTTNRADFTWPHLAIEQRIFDWDRYEFKARRPERTSPQPPRWFRSAETLELMPYSQRLRFDFGFRPKMILGSGQAHNDDYGSRHPSKVRCEGWYTLTGPTHHLRERIEWVGSGLDFLLIDNNEKLIII